MFIKPSNSGSSVGINKANNLDELKSAIKYAAKFDKKILIIGVFHGDEMQGEYFINSYLEKSLYELAQKNLTTIIYNNFQNQISINQ